MHANVENDNYHRSPLEREEDKRVANALRELAELIEAQGVDRIDMQLWQRGDQALYAYIQRTGLRKADLIALVTGKPVTTVQAPPQDPEQPSS